MAASPQKHQSVKSELKTQRELHDPWGPHGGHFPKTPIHLLACGVKEGEVIYKLKLRMVEGVVKFPAELDKALFALQWEVLHEGKVPIVDAWTPEDSPGCIAKISLGWPGKGRGVEPAVKAPLTPGEFCRSYDIHADAVSTPGNIGIVGRAKADALWRTCSKGRDAREVPVVEHVPRHRVLPFSASFGQVPEVIDGELMALVIWKRSVEPDPSRPIAGSPSPSPAVRPIALDQV